MRSTGTGFKLIVTGYTDKLSAFLGMILEQIRDFAGDEALFDTMKVGLVASRSPCPCHTSARHSACLRGC